MSKLQREAELWKAEKIRQLEMQIYINRTLLSHMRQELKELRNLRGKQLESLLRKGTAQ